MTDLQKRVLWSFQRKSAINFWIILRQKNIFHFVAFMFLQIKAVYAGLYSEEVYACKILVQNGFDIYLLDEKYVGGKKADAFFEKGGRRDFLELKHTKDKKITGLYNDSIEQAPNCFIVIDGYMSKVQKKNLNDAVYKNDRSKEVYVYLKRTGEFIKIK